MVEKAGGTEAMLACGPVYAPPFEVQAVAWAMRLHSREIAALRRAARDDDRRASRPRSRTTRASRAITENTRWIVTRNCRGGTP